MTEISRPTRCCFFFHSQPIHAAQPGAPVAQKQTPPPPPKAPLSSLGLSIPLNLADKIAHLVPKICPGTPSSIPPSLLQILPPISEALFGLVMRAKISRQPLFFPGNLFGEQRKIRADSGQ